MQQWKILEERDQEQESIRDKTIIHLLNFINSLTRKNHEVLLGTDANEPNILYNNGVSQLLQHTKLIEIINENHELCKVPNTYIRGHHRIDYFFCTYYISSFINRSSITSFNKVTPSDHRGVFIDLHLQDFLKNSYALTSKASYPTLQSTNEKAL